MTKYQLIQRLQNSPLTRWMWKYWQHDGTGRICIFPFWKSPGKGWYRCNFMD